MAAPGTDAGLSDPGQQAAPATARHDRWKRLASLFYACSEMSSQDWPAFLATACGEDAALRQEVESLLASADETVDFLKQPVRLAAQEVAAEASLTNRRVGNYELIQQLGEGGMGDVWLAARADEQFQHRVAIKLMRAGFEQNRDLLPGSAGSVRS